LVQRQNFDSHFAPFLIKLVSFYGFFYDYKEYSYTL
jgi:hypothetical protein